LGHEVEMHKYAVQITVADVRDGACSSSTLKEACSWGKVDVTWEQMVFAEATTVVPLIASDAWHRGSWKTRERRRWAKLFERKAGAPRKRPAAVSRGGGPVKASGRLFDAYSVNTRTLASLESTSTCRSFRWLISSSRFSGFSWPISKG